jgi:hypothetical protein
MIGIIAFLIVGCLLLAAGGIAGICIIVDGIRKIAQRQVFRGIGYVAFGVLSVPIIAVVFSMILFSVCTFIRDDIGQRKIFKADRKELLASCRQMIANYDKYTNDWADTGALVEGEKGIELTDWKKGQSMKKSPPIPDPIKSLDPSDIIVATNHVIIQPHYPMRTRIIGFSEGTKETIRLGGRVTQLTNGLYFYHF